MDSKARMKKGSVYVKHDQALKTYQFTWEAFS